MKDFKFYLSLIEQVEIVSLNDIECIIAFKLSNDSENIITFVIYNKNPIAVYSYKYSAQNTYLRDMFDDNRSQLLDFFREHPTTRLKLLYYK